MFFSARASLAGIALFVVITLAAVHAAAADVTVCVEVRTKSWSAAKPAPPPKADADKSKDAAWKLYARDQAVREAAESNPHEFDAAAYLGRMMEYEVTHEVGFAAVKKGCAQRIDVELYPIQDGWTVFARYSGNQREEKVEYAGADEFGVLARRLARALLRDVPVTDTITRTTVLRADTELHLRKVGVQPHLIFGLGTALRFGALPSASGQTAPQDKERLFTPATVMIGYRGKFQQYGLDAFARANLGLADQSPSTNSGGGHTDYEGGFSVGLHFLYYIDPDGITSLYAGGGASFELTVLSMIRPADQRQDHDRDTLVTGGLNIDLLAGYEFMRASAIHFFAQLEANAPTYGIHSERRWGVVDTYLPGASAQIGVIF